MSYVKQNKNIELEILKTPLTLVNNAPATPTVATTIKSARILPLFARFALDLVLIYTAFLLAYFSRFYLGLLDNEVAYLAPVTFSQYLSIGLFFTLTLFGMLYFKNFYKLPRTTGLGKELILLGNAVLVSTAVVTLVMLLTQPTLYFSRLVFIYLVPITFVLLGAERIIAFRVRRILYQNGIGVRNLIVVGATDTGVRLMRSVTEKTGLGYKLLGFVDDQIRYSAWTIPARYGSSIKNSNKEVPNLGQTTQLRHLISQHKVDEVIIALPSENYETIGSVIAQCREQGITFTLVPDLFQMQLGEMSVREINGVPLIVTDKQPLTGMNYAIKRGLDLLGSLALITIAAIPMIIVAIAVKLDSEGPVIFRQTRVGKDGKTFTFYKFRSMYTNADARLAELEKLNETNGATFKMKNDPRVTRVGRFIRRTSLDELPQLFNVLFGQMSLVGPRPGLPREVARYQPWQHRRLEITPGLTGLWQVSGRSSVGFEDMVKLDIYYAEHWTPAMDLKILFKTIQAVVKGDGAY